jgi:hypothetical protein
MSKIIADYTGSITRPTDNTVRYINENRAVVTEVYPDTVDVIALTDMDGEIWVYAVPAGYNILVDDGDIVNKHAVLAELDI